MKKNKTIKVFGIRPLGEDCWMFFKTKTELKSSIEELCSDGEAAEFCERTMTKEYFKNLPEHTGW